MKKETKTESLSDIVLIETDFVKEDGEPIVVEVDYGVFERARDKLTEIGLTPRKTMYGLVFVGTAAGIGYVIKKSKERKIEDKSLGLNNEELTRFANMTEEYWDKIRNYLQNRTGNPSVAEDLTQNVFISALLNYNRFEYRTEIENPENAWLFKIANNRLKNYYRDTSNKSKRDETNQTKNPGLIEKIHATVEEPEHELSEKQKKELLAHAIQKLVDDRARFAIYLKLLDLTNKEIAEIFDTSEGTIKSLIYRIMKSLKNFVKINDFIE